MAALGKNTISDARNNFGDHHRSGSPGIRNGTPSIERSPRQRGGFLRPIHWKNPRAAQARHLLSASGQMAGLDGRWERDPPGGVFHRGSAHLATLSRSHVWLALVPP